MAAPTAYDQLPYVSYPFWQTHPDHLCALACLFGAPAPDPRSARVIEIGCSTGGNLIPMAEQLPGATFVGVDLSARQIATARDFARRAGVGNVEFVHADITNYKDNSGPYDYIIAHGVYSWMPEPARDALMAFTRTHLSADGIGYISYNTFPGWHLRGAVRDMMLYHTERFPDDASKLGQARALLDFLARNAGAGPGGAYRAMLGSELETLKQSSDAYLRHEHLSGDNHPMYFHEFCRHANRHRLKFLAEADLVSQTREFLNDEARTTLETIAGDLVRAEQYVDFLRNRTFRQSLLVRAERRVHLSPQPDGLDGLALNTEMTPTPAGDSLVYGFEGPGNMTMSTENPRVAEAMSMLCAHRPDRINTGALLRAVSPSAEERRRVRDNLLRCVQSGIVQIHSTDAPYAIRPPAIPRASNVARAQIRDDQVVTSLQHRRIELDSLESEVLQLADGERDLAEITNELIDIAVSGRLRLAQDARVIMEPADIRQTLELALPATLASLAGKALLLA